MRYIQKYIHKRVIRFIARFVEKCGGAFHCRAYGPDGRYVVIMSEQEYHLFMDDIRGGWF